MVEGYAAFIRSHADAGALILQPRMGFGTTTEMRNALQRIKCAHHIGPRIGTVTVDAYTRMGQVDRATAAIANGERLNGFPILSHDPEEVLKLLDGIRDANFPVQIRHGTAFPYDIFKVAATAGFDAIEGGPISYTLPYSRVPLSESVEAWVIATKYWARHGMEVSIPMHIETFGGCMLGQLCPPSLLIAISVLEGLFFIEQGIQSFSLSLTQGIDDAQDVGAILALRWLSEVHFSGLDWHLVYYTFMGLFPETVAGCERIIRKSAALCVKAGVSRLIVKTAAEATSIPTVDDNIQAMLWARSEAEKVPEDFSAAELYWAQLIENEAKQLIRAVLDLPGTMADKLVSSFRLGFLDVPFCLHPGNKNSSRPKIDEESGALVWDSVGGMPLHITNGTSSKHFDATRFTQLLWLTRNKYDR